MKKELETGSKLYKELKQKLEGVVEVIPSFLGTFLTSDGNALRIIHGNALLYDDLLVNIERILINAREAGKEDYKEWLYGEIPNSLKLNAVLLAKTIVGALGELTGLLKQSYDSHVFSYSWEDNRWFVKSELTIDLLSGDEVKAVIYIDPSDTINFNGEEIGLIDLEYQLKKFFIVTVTNNIDNINEDFIKGLDKL